jgi:hypothetical protein
MEKAGLQRPSIKKWDQSGSTVPDMPAIVVSETPDPKTKQEKKNFFSQLKFD